MVCNCASFYARLPSVQLATDRNHYGKRFQYQILILYLCFLCVFYLQLSLRAAKLFLQSRQNNYVMT